MRPQCLGALEVRTEPERAPAVYRKLELAQGLMDATVGIISNRKFRDDADSDPILRRRR
ncbi:hypothetical protein NB231_14413 [Nitrococcus mobilis Nb-231]|uniref:Uncharacterized protein n=1 Tax=Nitrococcus mobilis Nb-231 TaxID=314278 RepID=A4BL33_9GAMM|nr:hypothetical protein NB231_14413 [Nitrococcus mobilis Nb-231]